MKFPFINNPKTGKPDVMVSLTVIVTMVVISKFLLDGVSIIVGTYAIGFGHVDSLTYGTILGPILGAHSYMEVKKQKEEAVLPNDNKN